MSTNRTLLRTVVPPLLALCLVGLAVHPMQAVAGPSGGGSRTAPAQLTLDADRVAQPAAGNAAVSVPVVAFQQHAALVEGRLRTAVLVNVSAPGGRASVDGQPGCSVVASPGVPAWLSCPATGATTITVRVTLDDGRVFTDSGMAVLPG